MSFVTLSHPEFDELEYKIEYSVSGKYYPATREEPEEFPEFEVVNIQILFDIQEALEDADGFTEEDFNGEKIMDYLESKAETMYNAGELEDEYYYEDYEDYHE